MTSARDPTSCTSECDDTKKIYMRNHNEHGCQRVRHGPLHSNVCESAEGCDDSTANVCACYFEADQPCDTAPNPHACISIDGGRSDANCVGIVFPDEPLCTCAECAQDFA